MNKVSICVPIYNTEKYIEKCVISLFEQTYPNIEFIFVDDKSPDNSILKLRQLIEKYHKEKETIIISHEKNRGLAAARNSGVEACSGDFIMHVDSDDYLEKNTVELAIQKQMETNADIVSFGLLSEYQHYNIVSLPQNFSSAKEMSQKQIARLVNINLCGRLYKTELYKNHHISAKEGVDMGEDYQVSPILTYYAKQVASINIPLYHYNCKNANSYCGSNSMKKRLQAEESVKILFKFFENKKDYKDYIDIAQINLCLTTIKFCTKRINKENIKRFHQEVSKTRNINIKDKKAIPIIDRSILYCKSYPIAFIYINFLRYCKKVLASLKQIIK